MFRSRGARRLAPIVSGALVSGLLVLVAPSAAALDSPGGLATTEGSARILSWSRVADATSYDVQVAKTSSFSPTVASVSTVNDEYVPVVQLPVGDVWWRVRARSGKTIGDWATASFSTATRAAPVPVGPNIDQVFTPPEAPRYTWEPVAGATSYTVQTSADIAFTDPKLVYTNTQKTTAAYLTSYLPPGYYYWRVQAELTSGYSTRWSEPRRYRLAGLPAPQPLTPANTFEPDVLDVELSWAPVAGAKTYELDVSLDDAFTKVVLHEAGLTNTRHTPKNTLDNDQYYWRVRAIDASGREGAWSTGPDGQPWKFQRAWPDQPSLIHPAQGATTLETRPFYYQWEPIERASKYVVHLQSAAGVERCTVTTVHTTLSADEDELCRPKTAGTWRWKVEGLDDGSTEASTDVIGQQSHEFVYTPQPGVVAAEPETLLVSDVQNHRVSVTGNGAFGTAGTDYCSKSGIRVVLDTCNGLRQTPVLTWDRVEGAVSYRVTIANDRELTNKVAGWINMRTRQPMWTPPPGKSLPDNQAGSAYWWIVRPCWTTDANECAPEEHATHSFAKQTVAPVLTGPANGAVVSDDVTLTWGTELAAIRDPASAPLPDVTTPGTMEARDYTVQTSLYPGFDPLLETMTVDQPRFTSWATTYPEGNVYWRVRANDGAGSPGVWSETRTFYKKSPVPVPVTPVNGEALGLGYTLTWQPLAFAASYDVEVYAGPDRVAEDNSKYSSWSPSTPFPASADGYKWRVRRVDAQGRQGDWSTLQSFTFGGFPVSQDAPAPAAVVPATGARFTWLSDPRATSYRFERRKPGVTDLAENVSTRATAWAPTSALPAGTAQWRVVALDAAGKSLGASPWRDFKVTGSAASADKKKSTTKIKLSATRTTVKKRVTATVTVSVSGVSAPGGSVSFYVGKKRVKVLPLGKGRTVTLKLPKQKAGIKVVRAVYAGGPQALGSSSAKVKLKVTRR
jgi:hypothetical protein